MAALPAGEWLFKIILEARKRKSSNNGLMSDEPGIEHNIHGEDEHEFSFQDPSLRFPTRAAEAPKARPSAVHPAKCSFLSDSSEVILCGVEGQGTGTKVDKWGSFSLLAYDTVREVNLSPWKYRCQHHRQNGLMNRLLLSA